MLDDKEAMYVFDSGYVDYDHFDRFMDDGLFYLKTEKNR